jgi:hypothetical protein
MTVNDHLQLGMHTTTDTIVLLLEIFGPVTWMKVRISLASSGFACLVLSPDLVSSISLL